MQWLKQDMLKKKPILLPLDSGETIHLTLISHLNGIETEIHCEKSLLQRGQDKFLESCCTNIDWCRILTI